MNEMADNPEIEDIITEMNKDSPSNFARMRSAFRDAGFVDYNLNLHLGTSSDGDGGPRENKA